MDRGAWRATVQGVAKSQARRSTHGHICSLEIPLSFSGETGDLPATTLTRGAKETLRSQERAWTTKKRVFRVVGACLFQTQEKLHGVLEFSLSASNPHPAPPYLWPGGVVRDCFQQQHQSNTLEKEGKETIPSRNNEEGESAEKEGGRGNEGAFQSQ